MGRKSKEEMNLIKEKHNVMDSYSWSRYNSSKTSLYTYFLKYVLHIEEDLLGSMYSNLGNILHDCIERIHLGDITREEAIEIYKDSAMEMSVLGLTFNRTDEESNDKIGDKYNKSNLHFLENFETMKGENQESEAFLECKIGSFLFIGYIDHKMEEDGFTVITDWKSSTIYTGDKIEKEKNQLILYAISEIQNGKDISEIKCRWCFTKYCIYDITQLNGKVRNSNMLRCEIGSKLKSSVSSWLKKEKGKYSEIEIDAYLQELLETNDISHLPEEIQSKYKLRDCFVYIDITQEAIDELTQDIRTQIYKLVKLEEEYKKTKDNMLFYDQVDAKSEYFHAHLSGYSTKYNLPYRDWLEQKNIFKNREIDNDEISIEELMRDLL